jgi:hypothetical protein
MAKRWTNYELDFIKKYYIKTSAQYCAEVLKKTPSSVHHQAERLKLKKYGQELNMKLFEELNDPRIIYFLGLFWADGHIMKNNGILLTLAKNDMDEVDHIVHYIGKWNTYIRIPKNPAHKIISMKRLSFHPLYILLKTYDFDKKSLLSPSKILNKIPKELHNFFWRGFFDGDGCIFIHTKQKYNHGCISFAGSYTLDWTDLSKYLNDLDIKFSITRKESKKGHKSSSLIISNKTGIQILGKEIFEKVPVEIGFSRKRRKYLDFQEKENINSH